MMAEPTAPRRRVLVALDPCEVDLADFEASARLAAGLDADLVGLLVEDADMIAAADLPVTHLIPAGCRGLATVDAASMRRAFRVAEARARERLSSVAERWRLSWSFEVTEVRQAAETLSHLKADDLLALGGSASRRTVVSRRTAAVRAERASCPVLLLRREGRPGQPVAVIYEGGQTGLSVGGDLARIYESPLLVLAAGEDESSRAAHESEAANWLEARTAPGVARPMSAQDAASIGRLLCEVDASLVIVDRRAAIGGRLDLDALAQESQCSIVVLGAH